jgi:hypothetical protein
MDASRRARRAGQLIQLQSSTPKKYHQIALAVKSKIAKQYQANQANQASGHLWLGLLPNLYG